MNDSARAMTVRLFLLFSMQEDAAPWQALIDETIAAVQNELKPDADENDIRLCYYAAAKANLRYRQILAAHGAVSPTYAGSVPRTRDDSTPCSFAERLVTAYRAAAAELLTDRGFVFANV
ncbi:MAG: hypothetical protein J6Z45_05345 [Oscillospiraceae bacterium]|nr:hypothetical protein [Oscillospiraceae bacterium]